DGVDLVCQKLPGDAVADMDPELVRKKRQNLTSLVRALDAGERMPLGRLCTCGKSQQRNDHGPGFHTPSSTQEFARAARPFVVKRLAVETSLVDGGVCRKSEETLNPDGVRVSNWSSARGAA